MLSDHLQICKTRHAAIYNVMVISPPATVFMDINAVLKPYKGNQIIILYWSKNGNEIVFIFGDGQWQMMPRSWK